MNDLYIAFASMIAGILATLLVGRYYFRQTISKSLTPYVQFTSSVFAGLDPSLRESLKIHYKGIPIDDLLEVQFLIANTGTRAIRDVITPLSVTVPDSCTLLDAAVLHVSPAGRTVEARIEGKKVVFDFALLNADEFFIAKILLQGFAKLNEFKFTITVDDIPPVLEPEPQPPDMVFEDGERKFELPILIAGLALVLVGFSFVSLIYNAVPAIDSSVRTGFIHPFNQDSVVLIGAIIAAIPCVLFLVLGVMAIVGSFTNFSFGIPRHRRFVVPSDLVKSQFRFINPTISRTRTSKTRR